MFSPPEDFKIDQLVKGQIDGISIYPLKRIMDERGAIFHFMKNTDPHFTKFGEVYFSMIQPNVVKAWHWHSEMELNYVCVSGRVKVVLVDTRKDSKTFGVYQEVFLGPENYCLLKVSKRIWNGFKSIGNESALIANTSDIPHDPKEIFRLDPDDKNLIPYNWDPKNG